MALNVQRRAALSSWGKLALKLHPIRQMTILETKMTHNLTRLKLLTASILAISVTACSTAPQNGVVATDLSGSLSQMWSGVFTGDLRPAPQPSYQFSRQASPPRQYAFGVQDTYLERPRLQHHVSQQAAYQPHSLNSAPRHHGGQHYAPQKAFPQHFVPQARIQPRALPTRAAITPPQLAAIPMPAQSPVQRPVQSSAANFASYKPQPLSRHSSIETPNSQGQPNQKRSFGARIRSLFGASNDKGYKKEQVDRYEDLQSEQSIPYIQTQVNNQRPAQSQPVIADPTLEREAYPLQASTPSPAIIPVATIPPRASIDDNLAKTGRNSTAVSAGPTQDWQAANQEIGDSLSYVKMGGGSKISEWQDCEKQAGGYFIATPTGFIVDPKFDVCMRGFGYKPEAEAEAILSAKAPVTPSQRSSDTQIAQTREIDTNAIPTSRRYPSRERRGS